MDDSYPLLLGQWVHSHEEDVSGAKVYRPPDFNFPRSRGRTSMHFFADGTCVFAGPGPTDKTERRTLHWRRTGDELIVQTDEGEQHFVIETIEEGRLVLRQRGK